MFTLKPGSCLISPANFFASPFSTAANMMHPRKDKKRNPLWCLEKMEKRKKRKRKGRRRRRRQEEEEEHRKT